MDVFAFLSFCVHVGVGSDLALRDLRQLSNDIEAECTELLDVDTLASTQRVVQVGDQGPPDDLHLHG